MQIDLPEKVDVIISEPMGYMLYNERMLESYLHAKKWLKPGGKMFPTKGVLYVAPFTDESLYMEQDNKALFWYVSGYLLALPDSDSARIICDIYYHCILYIRCVLEFCTCTHH